MSTPPNPQELSNQSPIANHLNSQIRPPEEKEVPSKEEKGLWGHEEKQLVLFAYHYQPDEQPPQDIMIMQQPKKKVKKETPEQTITRMMGQCGLESDAKQEPQLFLTKVGASERMELSAEIREMAQRSHSEGLADRKARRQAMFEAGRAKSGMQEASQEVIAGRKIRVVKLDSLREGGGVRGVVQLGGVPVQYEDLLANERQEYYTLVRRNVAFPDSYPHLSLDRDIIQPIQFATSSQSSSPKLEDDYDSNSEDNPDYDYPDEDDSQAQSIPSEEDLIGRGEGYWGDSSEGEWNERGHSEEEEDEEEVYRRYLRKERQKESRMEEEYQYVDYDYE